MRFPEGKVKCWITSPPYFRKVDYEVDGQFGLESSLDEYIENQTRVAELMLKHSRSDATLWYVVQDTNNGTGQTGSDYKNDRGEYRFVVTGPRESDWPWHSQLCVPEKIGRAHV